MIEDDYDLPDTQTQNSQVTLTPLPEPEISWGRLLAKNPDLFSVGKYEVSTYRVPMYLHFTPCFTLTICVFTNLIKL